MKTINDKEVQIGKDKINYKELLKICVNTPPQGGYTPEDMKNRVKILSVIDSSNGEMKFEDAEYNTLKECVNKSRWNVLAPELVEFIEYVGNVKA